MSFGSNMRYIRVQKNITLPQLAESLGVSANYLSKLEQDKGKLKPEFLPKLAEALDIDMKDFYRTDLPAIFKR
ncbi:helix-turn-helix domain-containing protein [Bacillus sp. EB01]|uniref:helix-turn-helix domain-containing protein n=1 Tax=Bacillus sp. EB01 TaxID=1347086 RepID=UPI0005C52073|nr:helix-turn-helix transcriptional regulator [Bacillus sp. EB01]